MFELNLQDLRILGRRGNSSALLFDGKEAKLRKNDATIMRTGVINGERMKIPYIISYVELYSQIRTIKHNNVVVAIRTNEKNKLLATGRGYKRPEANLKGKA